MCRLEQQRQIQRVKLYLGTEPACSLLLLTSSYLDCVTQTNSSPGKGSC